MSSLLFLNLGTPEILILIIGGIPFILMLISIIDIAKSDFKDSTTKLMWVLIVFFLPVLGSLIYLLIGRSQKVLPGTK
ncbi:MAG: PLDc_N domain-containing protein [Sphingobacteriaceae bacterium]|nr:PLDc_N domain-containing protein [Sphingobacteriaceae bacterium]